MAKKRNPPRKSPIKTPVRRVPAGEPKAVKQHLDVLYGQIREILTVARDRAWQAVNTAKVEAHWEIGRVIV